MYDWRKMTEEMRARVLDDRKRKRRPWHSPPHHDYVSNSRFLITAACFEHAHVIGQSASRMAECEDKVLEACRECNATIYAWCILPNHYHLLIKTDKIKEVRKSLGLFHGRSSNRWNKEDSQQGRQTWFNCFERKIKSERHFKVSLNYVNNNAVYHGYVSRWQDWAFSSATEFLQQTGHEEAERLWREYPILDYGKKWDIY